MSRYPLSRRILAPLEQLILPLPHDEPPVVTSTETFACATVTGCANAKRPQIPIRLAQTFITYPSSNGRLEDSTFVHTMIGAESPAGGQLSCKPLRTTGWDHLLDAANGPCQCRIANRSRLLYRRVDSAGGYGGQVCAVVSFALAPRRTRRYGSLLRHRIEGLTLNPVGATPAANTIIALAMESSLDCILVVDEAGHVLALNRAAEATFGYTRAQALGVSLLERIVPSSPLPEKDPGEFAPGIPGILGKRVERTAIRADGTAFPVELALTDSWSGERRYFTVVLRDLSERHAADAAFRASEARLAAFMKYAPVGMYLKDADGRYLMANPEMTKVFGRLAESVIGLTAADVFGAEEAEMIAQNDRRVLESGQAVAVEEYLENIGDYAWSLVVRFPVLWADQARIGGFDIDITEQKRAAERLQESERRFRVLTHHHPVPVVFIDRKTLQLLIANPAFREMMGVGPSDEERFRHHRWFSTREAYQHIKILSRQQVRADGIETEFQRMDGTVFPVSLNWRHIEMDGHSLIVGSVLDLTATKAAEAELARSREALAQSERLNALGSLLAGVSHELNNPLTVVVGQSGILEEELSGTAQAERAGKIKRAADRCARIVQTFLAMARARKPERRSVDINELIRAALDIAGYGLRASGIEVITRLADSLPQAEVDPDQLHQVLYNLIVNAQQALGDVAGQRRIEIESALEGNDIRIAVSDNGPGVPAEIRSRVFDPFFTTKPQGIGTGIGLSFSMGVVQAHKGTLKLLDSTAGARFELRLPVVSASEMRQPIGEAAPSRGGVGRTALVVDDEPDVAEALAAFLEYEGYDVSILDDVAAAKLAMASSEFDAVFCDLRMPGLDGPHLFDWATANMPQVADRFVFVTGDTLGSAAAQFLERARRPVIEKPFSREAIRKAIAVLSDGLSRDNFAIR
jgi:PAS domain S-box-containing protein